MVVGPNTPISNGSLMPSIEAQVDFALSFVDQIQRQGVKSAVVSQSATTEFNDHKDAVMELLTFSGTCNSWYDSSIFYGVHRYNHCVTGTKAALPPVGLLGRGQGQ